MSSSSSSKDASSFSAFREVDDLVSKPVLGSDGSASWQEFQKTQRRDGPSVAPSLPMKRAAQLGTGFNTFEQERVYENKVRAEAGDALLGSGYTAFKRKVDQNEVIERKRLKRVMDRIRPDNVVYYIPSMTFQGWKEDYVFTTRERGVGYYWDGMDSYKKAQKGYEENKDEPSSELTQQSTTKVKTNKKEATITQKIEDVSSQPISTFSPTSYNHQHSVIKTPSTADIDRAILTGSMSLSRIKATPIANSINQNKQWESATDPTTGREYYFCRATGESTWEKQS